MPLRYLLLAFLTFAILAVTGSIAAAVDNNTASMDTKARFICNYEGGIAGIFTTRLIRIDKKTDNFLTLQAQIASFFPGEEAKFIIGYKLLKHGSDAKRIDVVTDDDARNLMALYEALTRDLSNPVPIALYVKRPLHMGWDFWLALGFLLAVNVFLFALIFGNVNI